MIALVLIRYSLSFLHKIGATLDQLNTELKATWPPAFLLLLWHYATTPRSKQWAFRKNFSHTLQKHIKDNKHNIRGLHFGERSYVLSLGIICSSKLTVSSSIPLRKLFASQNRRSRTSVHIFAPNGGYCLSIALTQCGVTWNIFIQSHCISGQYLQWTLFTSS